jgi:hypothetical protein
MGGGKGGQTGLGPERDATPDGDDAEDTNAIKKQLER